MYILAVLMYTYTNHTGLIVQLRSKEKEHVLDVTKQMSRAKDQHIMKLERELESLKLSGMCFKNAGSK